MAFGELPSVWSRIAVWSAVFVLFGCVPALQFALTRRWWEAAISVFAFAAVAFLVWRFAGAAYAAIVCAQTPCIVPNP
jgi:hypothetical protein